MDNYQKSLQNAITNCENHIQESFAENVFLGQSIVLIIQKVKLAIAKELAEEKYLLELDKAISDLEKTKQLYEEANDTIGISKSDGSLNTLDLCKQKFKQLITYSHIKEGDYISAKIDKDLTMGLEGYVIVENDSLVLQESDFKMTISLGKLTEIKILPHANN